MKGWRAACPTLFAIAMATVWLMSASSALCQTGPSPRSQPAATPAQRSLTGKDRKRVEELDQQIAALQKQANYAEAIPLAEEAASIRAHAQGEDHWATVDADWLAATFKLAATLSEDDRVALADAEAAEAQVFGLLLSGAYEQALQTVQRLCATRRRLFGEKHPDVASNLGTLALLHQKRGDFASAEVLWRRSLTLARELVGDEHPDVVAGLNGLGGLLLSRGENAAAERLLHQALEMALRVFEDDHWAVASVMNNLARALHEKRDYAGAADIHRKALAMRRKAFGPSSGPLAVSLHNLAMVLQDQGQHDAAEALYRDALAMKRASLGNKHPRVAGTLSNLAKLLADRGDFPAAEPLLGEALELYIAAFGHVHPRVVAARSQLASLLHAKGEYDAAEDHWTLAARRFEAARLRVSTTALERVQFAAVHSPLAPLAACLARNGKPSAAWRSLEANLARGLLDSLSARHLRSLTPAERADEERLIGRLAKLDEQIALLEKDADGVAHAQAEKLCHEREALLGEFVQFERELEEKYGVAAGTVYGLADIQAQLPADAALLAWVDMEGNPKAYDPSGEHWACVLRHRGEPRWAKLPGSGEGGAWTESDNDLAMAVREALSRRSGSKPVDSSALLDRLRAQRIAPIEPELSTVRHLVVLPAGWMAGVPIEALTDEYVVSYAPSGTMYAWLREKTQSSAAARRSQRSGRLLALGDPVFAPPKETRKPAPTTPANGTLRVKHQLDAAIARTRDSSYVPLPGTRREVEAIAKLFEATSDRHSTTRLLGSDASEQRLAELAASGALRGFRFIHLATHGEMDDKVAMRSALILSRDRLPDAMDRVLAGQEVYDGRLTAEQIVRTWELNAELVTVSACESALGKVSGGEGFLGFSQAFFVSGARSLVLSLWKVDDTATALLMIRFYENLLGSRAATSPGCRDRFSPISKAEALREAKSWLRGLTAEQVRNLCTIHELSLPSAPARGETGVMRPVGLSDRPFEDPYYWASFILIGGPD